MVRIKRRTEEALVRAIDHVQKAKSVVGQAAEALNAEIDYVTDLISQAEDAEEWAGVEMETERYDDLVAYQAIVLGLLKKLGDIEDSITDKVTY